MFGLNEVSWEKFIQVILYALCAWYLVLIILALIKYKTRQPNPYFEDYHLPGGKPENFQPMKVSSKDFPSEIIFNTQIPEIPLKTTFYQETGYDEGYNLNYFIESENSRLPAIIQEGTAIIISPLISLMKNQVDAIRNFERDEGIAHFLNSSLSKIEIANVKQDLLNKKTKLLYVAPESLTKEENINFLKGIKISFYAIDEAHCISEWGHDFRPDYLFLSRLKELFPAVPVGAFTATATERVSDDIEVRLGFDQPVKIRASFDRGNLFYGTAIVPGKGLPRGLVPRIHSPLAGATIFINQGEQS